MNAFDIPPFGWRMLSPRSTETIVAVSNLSRSTVARISRLKSWDRVTVGVARVFINGLGMDMDKPPYPRWYRICQSGIGSVQHLKPRDKDKPWQRGAKANRIKAIRKTLS